MVVIYIRVCFFYWTLCKLPPRREKLLPGAKFDVHISFWEGTVKWMDKQIIICTHKRCTTHWSIWTPVFIFFLERSSVHWRDVVNSDSDSLMCPLLKGCPQSFHQKRLHSSTSGGSATHVAAASEGQRRMGQAALTTWLVWPRQSFLYRMFLSKLPPRK